MAIPQEIDPEELLRRLFRGRRRFPRVLQALPFQVSFPAKDRTGYQARSVDVSRGGVLIAITDEHFALADAFALAEHTEGPDSRSDGCEALVAFGTLPLRMHAKVVRLVVGTEGGFALGLRFEHPLTKGQARLLHIPARLGDEARERRDGALASQASPPRNGTDPTE